MPVQPFTPPPAHPEWDYLRVGVDEASFAAQMEPCFRKYRLVKKAEGGANVPLTDEELSAFESDHALVCDWLTDKPPMDLGWHRTCMAMLQKLRQNKK